MFILLSEKRNRPNTIYFKMKINQIMAYYPYETPLCRSCKNHKNCIINSYFDVIALFLKEFLALFAFCSIFGQFISSRRIVSHLWSIVAFL